MFDQSPETLFDPETFKRGFAAWVDFQIRVLVSARSQGFTLGYFHIAPTGLKILLGTHSQDSATLHPGLLSFPPYGRSGVRSG
jgi:hypothetical protein